MRNVMPSGAEISIQDRAVRVDAAIAEERPVPTHRFDERRIAARDDDVLGLSGLGDHAPEGVGYERMAEERDAVGSWFVLVADAVRRGDVDAVGNGVRALNRLPRFDLGGAPFVLFGRMPADRGRVEQ